MSRLYIRGCSTFIDAMNTLKFELSVPEYYDTAIPEYFRKPRDLPKPIVNGVEVEWDEYLENHDDEKPIGFIPNPIYKAEDFNRTAAIKTPAEIVDLVINDVPFEFVNVDDMGIVLDIYEGYYNEIKSYIPHSEMLQRYINNMTIARNRLKEEYDAHLHLMEYIHPERQKPLTLIDILSRMKGY